MIDYSSMGQGAPRLSHDLKQRLSVAFDGRLGAQHLLSNLRIEVAGDTGRGSCAAYAVRVDPGGTDATVTLTHQGARYVDEFIRTANGWRIRSRHGSIVWRYYSTGPRMA